MRSIQAVFLVCSLSALPRGFAIGGPEAPVAESSAHAGAVERDVPEGLGAGEWASIRAAYEAGRHRVCAVGGEYRARNPGQQWTTRFDGRGFTTTPDAGGWSWGLELVRYGWGESPCGVTRPGSVSAAGAGVTYTWDGRVAEWYVNDTRGLEHGYTVSERPEDAVGSLLIELSIRGELRPEICADGRDVRFVDAGGAAMLVYAGLAVSDADDRALVAAWEPLAGGLRLRVDDRDARYPLSIDPIAQQAYLKASNTGAGDHFGWSVSIFGGTVVVGALDEDSNSTGVNGSQESNSSSTSGAAYVFVRNGTNWSQEAYLKASNTGANDAFGSSVSISGDTIVVGAPNEDSSATGVNGNESSNLASDSGAAYVFVRSGTSWSQQAYLKASNTETFDNFGQSVSVSGDRIVVGAPHEDSNAAGVNGNQSNNLALDSGAAYVFVRHGTTWSQDAYLKASNTETTDRFGDPVAVSEGTVVVVASGEGSNATGVNGDQSNNLATEAGAAYVFVHDAGAWSQQAYLKASNTEASDHFGSSASVFGDTLVVGARDEDSNAVGVNGDENNNLASGSGAAYVFVRNGAAWSQQAYLKASNTEAFDDFGSSASVFGDTLVVAATGEDSNAIGVNGNESSNLATASGAAYVFVRDGTTWSQEAYLKASNPGAVDIFGHSVSTSADTVVVGAFGEDSNSMGVNGNQSSNLAGSSGAAYVFDLFASVVYCTAGTSASGCQAAISSSGTASASASSGFSLQAASVEGQKDGLFFFGTNGRQANPWGNGTSYQCVVPPVVRASTLAGTGTLGTCDGSFAQDLNALWCPSCPKPGKNPGAGALVQAQLWYRDPFSTSNQTTSLSDAIEFDVAP